ncbi:MAG: class I SAM-dependent methyltransferase [Thermomicrobium sp.]|nr:class I SAM-dependent methyltransferase [Thermomicrobium sp.]MDW8060542.1 class I SAM-dependent methyltransferase [Thermomicrobium sp.]
MVGAIGRWAELERLARDAGGEWLTVARLAHSLAIAVGAELAVEIGVGCGVVTLWLAEAVAETGGRLIALEREPERIEQVTAQLEALGLAERVQLLQGDAHRTIRTIAGPIGFVRLGADRAGYADYLRVLRERLRPGAAIVAEGTAAPAARVFRTELIEDARFAWVELPLRGGCLVAVRRSRE